MYRKIMRVSYSGCWYGPSSDVYTTYIKDNGDKIFILNGEVVSKEDGNKHYQKTKKKCEESPRKADNYKYEEKVVEENISDEEYTKELDSRIDHYTCYIENYNQMKEAERKNERILNLIRLING